MLSNREAEKMAFWFVESRSRDEEPWIVMEGYDSLAMAQTAVRHFWLEEETRIVLSVLPVVKGASA